jgi:hypothetical protein
MRKSLFALSLFLVTSAVHAADFKLGLSNTTVAADFTSQAIGQGLEFTLGGLHNSGNGSLGTMGMQVSQQVNEGFKVSVGGKLLGVTNDFKDASALALGGEIDLAVPSLRALHFGVHGWFAPTVTSSSGTKTMQDIGASMAYRVLINAEVFAAYRRVQVDYESIGSQTLQSGPLFGMKLLF